MKKYKWSEPLCKSVLMDLCRRSVQNKCRTINRTLREKNLPVKMGRPARERQGIKISSLTLPLAAENETCSKGTEKGKGKKCMDKHSSSEQKKRKHRHEELSSSSSTSESSTSSDESSTSSTSSSTTTKRRNKFKKRHHNHHHSFVSLGRKSHASAAQNQGMVTPSIRQRRRAGAPVIQPKEDKEKAVATNPGHVNLKKTNPSDVSK